MSSPFIVRPRVSTRWFAFEHRCRYPLSIPLPAAATACGSGDEPALGNVTDAVSLPPSEISTEAERFEGALERMIHDDIDGLANKHYYVQVAQNKRLRLFEEPKRKVKPTRTMAPR